MSEAFTEETRGGIPPVVRVGENQKTEPSHVKTPQEELREVSESPIFDSNLLFNVLTRSPGGNEINMAQLLKESAGVWEGYSIGEHTQMAMGQFEKYFADGYNSSLLSKGDFRVMLALHDIAKPLAIQAGDKSRQHEYTRIAMAKVLESFALPNQQRIIITEIACQDHIGSYIKGNITSEQAAANIKQLAKKINVPIADLSELLITYYMSDAGSYTEDAGGIRSLDDLFIFNREKNQLKGVMKFAEPQQAELDALIAILAIKPAESVGLTPDVTEAEARLLLKKKFASVLGKSEKISKDEVLRKHAIEFIKMGVSEEHIVELFESGFEAPKEALDEFLERVIKPAVRERIFNTESEHYFPDDSEISVSKYGHQLSMLGYSLIRTVNTLLYEGVSPSAIKKAILDSNSYEDFLKLRDASRKDIHVAFPAANLDRVKNFLKEAGVSEQSISSITPGRIETSTAAEPTMKMVYEMSQKVFNKMFGIDDPTYSEALALLLIRSTDAEDLSGTLARAVRVGEELKKAGIHRDAIARLARGSGDLQGFIQLLSRRDVLVAKYVAKPVPELQQAIELIMKKTGDIYSALINGELELPLKYASYSDAQISASLPDIFSKDVKIIRSDKGIEIYSGESPKISERYLFRGEGSSRTGTGFEQGVLGGTDIEKLFDIYIEQKGIGHKATDVPRSGTFVSDDFKSVVDYYVVEPKYMDAIDKTPIGAKGIWVIKKEALSDVLLNLEVERGGGGWTSAVEFADIIPFRYVEYFFVSAEKRAAILTKYGADNTEIFGKPLKDAVIAVDGEFNQTAPTKKFLETRISALGLS